MWQEKEKLGHKDLKKSSARSYNPYSLWRLNTGKEDLETNTKNKNKNHSRQKPNVPNVSNEERQGYHHAKYAHVCSVFVVCLSQKIQDLWYLHSVLLILMNMITFVWVRVIQK